MKRYYDCSIDGRVRIEIEGDSREDCLEQLMNKTLTELIEDGTVDFELHDIDDTLVSETVTVKVVDIIYESEDEDNQPPADLPTEFTFEIEDIRSQADLPEAIQDCIYEETGWLASYFQYSVIDEK